MFRGALVGIVLSTATLVPAHLGGPPAPAGMADAVARVPVTRTIGPADDLVVALESLRVDGVTELRLAPGVYQVFDRDVQVHAGTAEQPITVIAADPDDPPLVRGSLVLQNPVFWTIDRLVFQGGHSGYEALRMSGGKNWRILRSEFMGLPGYSSMALLNIAAYRKTAPQAFRVAYSCFHNGPTSPPSVHDHLVYVTSSLPPSPSYISRNIFWANRNGAAIKTNSSNVRVNFNTFQDVAGAVTVQETGAARWGLRGVMTERNLVQTVRKLRGIHYTHVFWASMLDQSPRRQAKWLIRGNYAYSSNKPLYLQRSYSGADTVRIVGGGLHTTSGNPGFRRLGDCNGYRPTLPAAKKYGRWAGDGRSMLPPR